MEFEGKVAVITGAASGIGRAVTLALARLGTDIVVADVDDARMEEVRQKIENMGRRALTVHCDVSKDADVDNLAAQAISTLGRVDILMNNAGVLVHGYVEKMSIADWEWILGINILGVVRCVHAFLPHMLKRGTGYIVNTSSSSGLIASQPASVALTGIAYATTKFAIVGLSEGLYRYLRPKGIMVSVLCPGVVSTNLPFTTRVVGDDTEEVNDLRLELEKLFKPSGGLPILEPDDVAQITVKAMQENRFFIITHPEVQTLLMNRGQDMQKLEKYLQNISKSRKRAPTRNEK
jgi:NAD(P)-dependent dehydrogenase (short-subunit alcohol dehydrogenase family)